MYIESAPLSRDVLGARGVLVSGRSWGEFTEPTPSRGCVSSTGDVNGKTDLSY